MTTTSLALRWFGAGTIALALPLVAAAQQQAFLTDAAELRAGPSEEYPVVADLPPEQPVDVVGCNDGYEWCDVALPDGQRGWVYAEQLDYPYEGNALPLATYGAAIGVPIVAFALGNYWSSYYRDRPWYREQRWWGRYQPPPMVRGWRPAPPPVAHWTPRPLAPGWNQGPGRAYGRSYERPYDRPNGRPNWQGSPPPQQPMRQPQWQGRPNPPPAMPAPPVARPGGMQRPQPPMPAQPQYPMRQPQAPQMAPQMPRQGGVGERQRQILRQQNQQQ